MTPGTQPLPAIRHLDKALSTGDAINITVRILRNVRLVMTLANGFIGHGDGLVVPFGSSFSMECRRIGSTISTQSGK